jgi:Putative zinc ribbon domain
MSHTQCQSCAMPIESGIYCQYCVDERGNLSAFEERFDRMVQWMSRQKPDLPLEEARKQTLAYMAEMPAWKDNPKLKAALGK